MKYKEMNNNYSTETSLTTTLFDSNLLRKIKKENLKFKYDKYELIELNNLEVVIDLGDNLILRSLNINDYDKGHLELLSQLTSVGELTRDDYENRFNNMKLCDKTYFILIIEDTQFNKIIGSATLVNEQKFIHLASSRGRIEDVVVDETYRGKKLGKLLIDTLTCLSRIIGNYKCSLECKDKLRDFYQQFGYVLENGQNYLCQRF